MNSFGILPVARLRVIGDMTRRFCNLIWRRVVSENRSDITAPPEKWFECFTEKKNGQMKKTKSFSCKP
jgi:hypothetical protein